MEIRIINNVIHWEDIIGKRIQNKKNEIVCSNFEEDKLYIQEWLENSTTGITSVISTLDSEKCLAHLKLFGYDLKLIDGFAYSSETIQKAQGLILAGFNKLIKTDNNYMVDNIFQQNILLEDELQHLLSNNILEINLSEIK
ncbi:MAG: hypothetical protein RR191_05615 [Cetobacterium sp.]|uniref:hypothetical protein n=1 Tax=Cetobacterium sp. TaxID=2071632 RepID=UPI002FCC10DF